MSAPFSSDASGQGLADFRADGAHLDPDFARAKPRDNSILSVGDLLERGGIGHHRKRKVGRGGDGARRIGPLHSAIDQPLGFGTSAIEAGNGVSLVEQAVHHAAAHHAQSNES